MLDSQNEPHGYFRFTSTLLLGLIIGKIAEQFLKRSSSGRDIPSSFATYRKIVRYLDEFYNRPLERETMEKQFHHNYAYLCQLFKKYAAISMQFYVRELRIQRAKHLLDSTKR